MGQQRIQNNAGIDYDAALTAAVIRERYRVAQFKSDDAFQKEFSQWGMPKAGQLAFGLEYSIARDYLQQQYFVMGLQGLRTEMQPGLRYAFEQAVDAAGSVSHGAELAGAVLSALGMTELAYKMTTQVSFVYNCHGGFECDIVGFEDALH